MANATFRIDGLRELEIALQELPKATQKNVLLRTLKKRGEPIALSAQSRAADDPTTPGTRIQFRVGTRLTPRQAGLHKKAFRDDKASAEVFVGQRGAGPAPVQQEFGNVNHGPQAALRPAWDAGQAALLDGLGVDLWAEIEKSAKRLAKKQAKAAG